MPYRTQTTFTFNTRSAADLFVDWLRRSGGQFYYGNALFVDLREVGSGWCVEYAHNAGNNSATGVATGIELAAVAVAN